MSLIKLFDDLDNLITNKRSISEIKPVLNLVRDQAEALERDHAALKTAHAELEQAHSKLKAEHAETKAAQAKLEEDDRSNFGFRGIGEPL